MTKDWDLASAGDAHDDEAPPGFAGDSPTAPRGQAHTDTDIELLDSIEEDLNEVERSLARLDEDRS